MDKISHYRILKKLGAGGMGEVYLAEDMKLERTVAVKVLPPELAAEADRMKRFVREAKAASAVKHEHVAHIYEIGEDNGVNFIVMEYVEGESLNHEIASGNLNIRQILQIAIEIADSLSEAETKGIVHRDIKPANIIMTKKGHIKLLDFGLARMAAPLKEGTDFSTISRTDLGVALGTVPYMSPEQAAGRPVDHRTDIFSLGVVIYQMVTNRLPFSGTTAAEMVGRIIHEEPAPLARFNDRVPAELERIVRKCMEKEIERRYQSAADLRNDLERLQLALSSPGASIVVKRSKALPVWIAVVAFVVLSAVGFFLYRSLQHEPVDSLAVLPFTTTAGDRDIEYLSDGLTESLINNLSELSGLKVMSRSSVFRYKGQDDDPQKIGRSLNVKAVLTGRILSRNGELTISMELIDTRDNRHIWGQQYNRKTSDALSLQQEISNEVLDNLRVKFTEPERAHVVKKYTMNPDAYQLYLKGRFFWYENTAEGLHKAIPYFNQAVQKDPGYALAYVGLADCYNALGFNYILPADEIFPKAKTAALKALEIDHSLADAHIALGVYRLFYEWDWAGAENEARLARELSPRYSKSIELSTSNSTHFYCYYLDVLGHPDQAVAEQKKALLIDPLSFFFYAEMGWSYYVGRNYDESIREANKALEMDPSLVLAYLALGNSYRAKGMYKQSIEELKKARDLANGDPATLADVGYGFAIAGKREEAIQILDHLKQRSETGRIDPGNIAIIYIGLGEKDQAFEWLQKAYAVRSQWLTWIKVEPKFDPLRSDPRFVDLEKKVGLPL